MNHKIPLLPLLAVIAAGSISAQQPAPTVPMTNTLCNDAPKMVGGKPDTVASVPDAEGWVSLFNGTDLTGWWENCNRHADQDRTNGGIWVADPTQKILFSQQNENGAGGMLTTNKTFGNYELVFDIWPTFGNDGGVFNRNTTTGKNWQTTIDYIQGSGVGGTYNENGWQAGTTINDDPFAFASGPANPTISTWTNFTKDLNPTSFGCSAAGCVSADFAKIWNTAGWNQIRVKFYDGLTVGREVNMETFIRKVETPEVPWVPVYKNKKPVVTPPGFISLQIHQGTGRWKKGANNLYRNIKVRELLDDGSPKVPTSVSPAKNPATGKADLRIVDGMLSGTLDSGYDIVVRDLRGNVVDKFHGASGSLRRALPQNAKGMLFLQLKNDAGSFNLRVTHI